SILKAVLLAGIILLIITIRNILVLGELLTIVIYPSFSAIRLINIGEIFTRLEIIVNITLLAIGFIKFNIFYYSTVVGTAQLLKMRTYLPLVLPVGAMIVSISLLQYDTYMSEIFDTFYSFPLYSLVFELFLPLLTLLIIMIKRPEPAIKNSETVQRGDTNA
ncbi:MAG: GerAB/ArcD/ProY family transporter, partial [Syntrophomonadaceae bacterium]|nr:GerAB/ArcD/ProY family transporter [Syntrophomonadaceae bacterium]